MRPLSSQDILQVWEQGQFQHEIDRAITILAAASPGSTRGELAALTIGQRDSRLLTVRERTFGKALNGYALCPRCKERLQFSLATDDIRAEHAAAQCRDFDYSLDGFSVKIWLPDSHDLAAVAACPNSGDAYRVLLERCLTQVSRNGEMVQPASLPESVVSGIDERIAECDPQAEVLLDLDCSGCLHRWTALFDILRYFWREIAASARRLLQEVVILSREFGWREEDILALSSVRRRFYLDMVS